MTKYEEIKNTYLLKIVDLYLYMYQRLHIHVIIFMLYTQLRR